MKKNDIRNPADALAYFTDCQLATVADLAMKKSRSIGEFQRQKTIAQHMCDCMTNFGIVDKGNRYEKVIEHGSVEEYAEYIEKRFRT